MSDIVMLGILVFLGSVLTISGYALHRGSLAFAAATVWGILMAFSAGTTTWTWDIYQAFFWLGIGMLISSAVEGVTLSRGREEAEDEIEYGERIDEAMKDMDENIAVKRTRRRGSIK